MEPKKPITKQAAILAAIAALFVVGVVYYPPLKPVCVALSFCSNDLVVDGQTSVSSTIPQ